MFSTGVGIDIELLEETSKDDYTTRTLRLTDIQSGISRNISIRGILYNVHAQSYFKHLISRRGILYTHRVILNI